MANQNMDVLWTKENLKKIVPKDKKALNRRATYATAAHEQNGIKHFNVESEACSLAIWVEQTARGRQKSQSGHGRGDSSASLRCCRLCGLSQATLRRFSETQLMDGVEERYDQLLYDCFGICLTQPNCLICEDCIQQLRNARLFRALVFAAFSDNLHFDGYRKVDQSSGPKEMLEADDFKLLSTDEDDEEPNMSDPDQNFEAEDTAKPVRKAKTLLKRNLRNNCEVKRVNIACSVCKQRYPMMLPYTAGKMFICSRCRMKNREEKTKVRKADSLAQGQQHNDIIELKSTAKKRTNRFCVPKKPLSPMHRRMSPVKAIRAKRYECSQCTKKYILPQHLAEHINSAHGNTCSCVCAVCGKDMKTRDQLDRHLQIHTGVPIYQCDVCMRVFKSKRILQKHSLSHGILKSNSQ